MKIIKNETKFIRISSSKLKPTADLIRGKQISHAQRVLEYMPHRAAKILRKSLATLLANAEEQGIRNPDNLMISRVEIGVGPIMRRIRPMSRGQAFVIRKRMSHIYLSIETP